MSTVEKVDCSHGYNCRMSSTFNVLYKSNGISSHRLLFEPSFLLILWWCFKRCQLLFNLKMSTFPSQQNEEIQTNVPAVEKCFIQKQVSIQSYDTRVY